MGAESADQGGQRSESRSGFIDDACSRFETAWRAGQPPRIEDFLPSQSSDKGGATLLNLLVQLVGIDLEWRWKTAAMPAETQSVAKEPSPPVPLPETMNWSAAEGSIDGQEPRPDASGSSVPLPLGRGYRTTLPAMRRSARSKDSPMT
jgi:hypothetical protein